MSAAEVANHVDSNAQSAQDVQNMLAELKGASPLEKATDSAPVADDDVSQVSNHVENVKDAKTHDAGGENGIKASKSNKEDDVGAEKKNEGTEGEDKERSGGHRPYRGGARGRGSARGRGDFKSYKKNIKSDLTTQEETDDPVQIRKQVEFYFSDSNLPMDKFLLSQVGGSKNFPVDLKIIHSFKRMRRFQPFSAITAALKESTFLELTDDDTKVKRKEPLSEKVDPENMDAESIKVFEDRAMPRSVYVKGFGEEDSKTQLDIEAFIAPYGPYNAIRLRRAHDKMFKGSIFVEFDSEETQKKFLELEPKPKYKDRDLQIMSKQDYCEKKVEDIKSGKLKPNGREHYRGRGGHQNKRKRDDEDDRDWRERRKDDRKNDFRESRKGGRGRGRDSRGEQGTDIRRDARGVPIVESTEESPHDKNNSRAKREAATADALAKAKAMVEAENARTNKLEAESKQQATDVDLKVATEGKTDTETKGPTDAVVEKPEHSAGKKRGRDETEEDGDLPAAKRTDSKAEEEGGQESMES